MRSQTRVTHLGSAPQKQYQRANFDLSYEWRGTFSMGQLIPFYCEETIPGDTFRISREMMMRFDPLYFPIMQRVNHESNYFFVPNRLTWTKKDTTDGWERFISGGDSEADHPSYRITPDDWKAISDLGENTNGNFDGITTLFEYMGLPQPISSSGGSNYIYEVDINALPIAAYWKIWDDYYRRPQLQPEFDYFLTAGGNMPAIRNFYGYETFIPRRDNWNFDYFTAALPSPQAGLEIIIPLVNLESQGPNTLLRESSGLPSGAGAIQQLADGSFVSSQNVGETLFLDIAETAGTIRQLTQARALQTFLEMDNYTGDRYRDNMKGHFNVDPMPQNIDYAVWIGGGSGVAKITDVMSTAETELVSGISPLGSYAGKIMAGGQDGGINYTCTEHGYIIGLISVKPRSAYINATEKYWFHQDRLDYAWSEFAHLGDQAISWKELIAPLMYQVIDVQDPNEEWGYIERYAEYRYHKDVIAGEFRDIWKDWHMARDITVDTGALSDEFLQCEPRVTDVFQIADGYDEIKCHIWNQVTVSRQLPKRGVPIH